MRVCLVVGMLLLASCKKEPDEILSDFRDDIAANNEYFCTRCKKGVKGKRDLYGWTFEDKRNKIIYMQDMCRECLDKLKCCICGETLWEEGAFGPLNEGYCKEHDKYILECFHDEKSGLFWATNCNGIAVEGCDNATRKKKTIVVPEQIVGLKVVRISTGAFNGVAASEIILPDSVVDMGASFEKCSRLVTVKLPAKLDEIKEKTFRGCSKLQEVQIPSSVKEIGRFAFENCRSIEAVELPDIIEKFPDEAFVGCVSLTNVTFHGVCLACNSPEMIRVANVKLTAAEILKSMLPVPGKAFKMGKTEVTEAQFYNIWWKKKEALSSAPSSCYPIRKISWNDCQVFLNWLNDVEEIKKLGKKFRLPRVDEWQYVCKTGKTRLRISNLGDYAWDRSNSQDDVHAVATKKCNEWGFFDMLGNVEEWCQDQDTSKSIEGDYRYSIGGNFHKVISLTDTLPESNLCTKGYGNLGFRLVME